MFMPVTGASDDSNRGGKFFAALIPLVVFGIPCAGMLAYAYSVMDAEWTAMRTANANLAQCIATETKGKSVTDVSPMGAYAFQITYDGRQALTVESRKFHAGSQIPESRLITSEGINAADESLVIDSATACLKKHYAGGDYEPMTIQVNLGGNGIIQRAVVVPRRMLLEAFLPKS